MILKFYSFSNYKLFKKSSKYKHTSFEKALQEAAESTILTVGELVNSNVNFYRHICDLYLKIFFLSLKLIIL